MSLADDWQDNLDRPALGVSGGGKARHPVSRRKPDNWGRWGELDERGTLNLLTADRIVVAAGLVRTGRTVSCAIPITEEMPVHPSRPGVVHTFALTGTDLAAGAVEGRADGGFMGADDHISMPLQSATHWDGLAHVAWGNAMYNGYWVGNVGAYGGARRLSTHLNAGAVVGRGLLLDVARDHDVKWLEPGYPITPDDLEACARAEGVRINAGDLLLVRTGEMTWYYSLQDKTPYWAGRHAGLSRDNVEWLHGHDVAAVGIDNRTFEVVPFEDPYEIAYPVHSRVIRDLGLTIGELWWLDDLAEACRQEERWEFLLVAPPLNVINAAGAPVAPVAVF